MNVSTTLGTRSRTGTPIKAITSTLVSRSAPKVPEATELYEPLAKNALKSRVLFKVFWISGVAAWVLVNWWTSWQVGGFESLGFWGWVGNWFALRTVGFTVLVWLGGAVPVAVMRKVYITVTPITSTSPKETLALHLARPQTRRSILVLVLSSLLLGILHSLSTFAVEVGNREDPKLGLWTRSKKHPYHVNGRLLFLLLSQAIIAVFFGLRDVLRDRLAVKWSRETVVDASAVTLIAQLFPSIVAMLLLTTFSTTFALAAFMVSRMVILPFVYSLPVLYDILRPFTAHFLRPKFTLTFLWTHFDLITRVFFLNFTTAAIWDVTSTVFDVYSMAPVSVSTGVKDGALVIASGVSSKDSYFQLHAFQELASLASDEHGSSNRGAIYNDTRYSPTMWGTIVRQCLVILGRDYQRLVHRGTVPAPPIAPAPAPPPKIELPPGAIPATPFIRQPVFKTSSGSPLSKLADALSSDPIDISTPTRAKIPTVFTSPFPTAKSPPIQLVPPNTPKTPGRGLVVPSTLAGPSTPAPAHTLTPAPVASSSAKPDAGLGSTLLEVMPQSVKMAVKDAQKAWAGPWFQGTAFHSWWALERRSRFAIKCLPNRELDAVVVEALSKLLARSLKEDTYGVVQRDIPRILEAFSSFLLALEAFQKELASSCPELKTEQIAKMNPEELFNHETSRVEVAKAQEWIGGLIDSLRTALVLIVQTFKDGLQAFKFPPKTANHLQTFVDYSY